MSICPGGLTQPKPGIPANIAFASAGAGLLSTIPRLSGLAPLAYALEIAAITTTQLCAQEPPAMPTMTQAEVNALLGNQVFSGDYYSGLSKLKDMITILAWYELCQCQSGGAVSLPTPPVQPSSPVVSPTSIPNTTTLCNTSGPTTHNWAGWGGGLVNASIAAGNTIAGCVQEHVKLTITNNGGGALSTTSGHVRKYNTAGTQFVDLESFTIATTGVFERYYPLDPLFPRNLISATPDDGFGTGNDLTKFGEAFCSGAVASGPLNCCPPDPYIVGKLDKLDALVTLMQRQLAPFAYVLGAIHSGLSGTGVLAVSGLLGAKIVITSDPASLGIAGTSPAHLFDRGFITWGTPDGYPQSERLERATQLSLPSRCSAFTDLAYDLHPGVIVTITEIIREP